jgi:transposase
MPKSLPGHELLPPSPSLRMTDVQRNGPNWIIRADGPPHAACPKCGGVSRSRHSAYIRSLKDLPAVGATVSLHIRVSRWRCGAPACTARVFADRLPGVADLRARRTCRANVVVRLIAYALGGRAGEQLTTRIGLPVSNDTLLRWVKKGASTTMAAAQAHTIGVDEWAKRKGRTYGTIVVDLERHTVIDVLDSHTTDAVEQWLVAHPDIHTICRDRNGRYAKAARRAAPAARQVTDRFHLVQNLRETIERELALHRAYLRVRMTTKDLPKERPPVPRVDLPVCPPVARERRLPPARRLATETEIGRQLRQTDQNLFDTFKALQATGAPISVIARQLGCNRRRLDKWAKQGQLPARQKKHPSPGSAEAFREYLRQRWDAGYRNGRLLFDEIHALGYTGTHKTLNKLVSPWRLGNVAFERAADDVMMPAPPPPVLTDPSERQISPHIAAALLTTPRAELTGPNAHIVDALKVGCPGYAVMRSLMMGFRAILKQSPPTTTPKTTRTVTALHRWMDRARATGIALIQNFEAQLQRDILAVEAAVTERWSNGPVEGQVNRLKTIKRQMYGRAGVELLRARLIPLPVESSVLHRK